MEVKIFSSINQLKEQQWQALVDDNFPFHEYQFFKGLEETSCVGETSGWIPVYVGIFNDDELVAATYLFVKTHSYGEYIFDWEWARTYQSYGLNYYPKLSSAIPFTPATGSTFLIKTGEDKTLLASLLINAADQVLKDFKGSSSHFLFIKEEEKDLFSNTEYQIRHSFQYHWQNQSYSHFDRFLEALKGKRAKEIRRERKKVAESGLQLKRLYQQSFEPDLVDKMFGFYLSTIDKRYSYAYLNRDFFDYIFSEMKEKILLCLAFDEAKCVAGTLNFYKKDKLYGRYWGADGEFPCLHFELCYYQTIEFAIEQGIKIFEAGAQGQHKIQRGFLPSLNYSAHYIAHPAFKKAINRFIEEEKKQIDEAFQYFDSSNPYRPK